MPTTVLRELSCKDLGISPHTTYNLNGGSFQQDVLVTHQGLDHDEIAEKAFCLSSYPQVGNMLLSFVTPQL